MLHSLKRKRRSNESQRAAHSDVKDAIDISGLEQLVDDSQTNALTVMMNYFRHHLIDNHKSLIETNQMYDLIDEEGIEAISNFDGHPGNLAQARIYRNIEPLSWFKSKIK